MSIKTLTTLTSCGLGEISNIRTMTGQYLTGQYRPRILVFTRSLRASNPDRMCSLTPIFSLTLPLSPSHLPSCLQHGNDSFISLTTFAISRTGLLSSPVCCVLSFAQLKPDTNKRPLYIHYADVA